jgi:purine-binding chemotaxis protein CheW
MAVATEQSARVRAVGAEVLLFEVEQQRYAVPLSLVMEIVRAVAVEPLPRTPRANLEVILGVINVRGQLAPVLDLRRRFGWADRPLDPREHFVLLRGPARPLAIRSDRAVGLATLPPAALEEPTALVPGAAHVAGIARLPDGVLLVYDLPAFLDQTEARALEDALSEGQA